MHRRKNQGLVALIALGVAVAAVAATTSAFGGGGRARLIVGAPASPTPSELAAIQQLVLKVATSQGDPSPTNISLIPTTRQVAERIDAGSGQGYANTPVYFVIAHGHFTAYNASVPPGAPLPTGTVLTLTIDPATNMITDAGLESTTPNLNAIGVPQRFRLSTSG